MLGWFDNCLRRGAILEPTDLIRRDRKINVAAVRAATNVAYLGGGQALCRVLGRYKMYIDTNDMSLAPHLMLDGFWEIWVTEQLAEIVKPGMTCVDAGANLGYFTLLMADLAGPGGRVYAFEPNDPVAALLERSVVANGFASQVSVHRCLLENRNDAYMQLSVPEGFAGGAAMLSPVFGQSLDSLYKTKRMDSFAELLDADVVKIDAEGAEYAIWQGMTDILARGRPMTLLVEFVALRYADPRKFLQEILDQGFSLAEIHPVLGVVSMRPEDILSGTESKEFMLLLRRS